MASRHPGFAAVQSKIAKSQGIPKANAGAILASSSRRASSAAKAKNPRLNKVKGAKTYGKAGGTGYNKTKGNTFGTSGGSGYGKIIKQGHTY